MSNVKKEDLELLINNGLTLKEIANILNVSISTIKRANQKFKLHSKSNNLKKEIVICLECKVEFDSRIRDNRKFCSQSCSTTFNNKKRKIKEIKLCSNCEKEIKCENLFCSTKCQQEKSMMVSIKNCVASSKTIKRFLILNHGAKCMKCGWCEVNPFSGKIPIELEHKDGNSNNNSLDNVELLCPNCHSLTKTYKALNKGNGRYKRRERYKEGKSY